MKVNYLLTLFITKFPTSSSSRKLRNFKIKPGINSKPLNDWNSYRACVYYRK